MSWSKEFEDTSTLRVRYDSPGSNVIVGNQFRDRTAAEKIRDQILDDVVGDLEQAKGLVHEALELFTLLTTPQHKNLELLIDQQMAQVEEFRRVRQ